MLGIGTHVVTLYRNRPCIKGSSLSGLTLRLINLDFVYSAPHCVHQLYSLLLKSSKLLSRYQVSIGIPVSVTLSIRATGPVWTTWSFPTKRHCGFIGKHIKSRHFPYENLNNFVMGFAHLTQV